MSAYAGCIMMRFRRICPPWCRIFRFCIDDSVPRSLQGGEPLTFGNFEYKQWFTNHLVGRKGNFLAGVQNKIHNFTYISIYLVNKKAKPLSFPWNLTFFLATQCFLLPFFILRVFLMLISSSLHLLACGCPWCGQMCEAFLQGWAGVDLHYFLGHAISILEYLLLYRHWVGGVSTKHYGNRMVSSCLGQTRGNHDIAWLSSVLSWHFHAEVVLTMACRPDCSHSMTL